MYDIGVYDANTSNQGLGIYSRVVNLTNYRDSTFDGCVGVPLPIIAKQDMKPVILSEKSKLEAYFEKHGIYIYESDKYLNMARVILNNGAVPYLMPYPMGSEAEAVSSYDVYGGTEKVSVSFKFVGSGNKETEDLEKAMFLDMLNGAVATAKYENKKLSITFANRNNAKHIFTNINETMGVNSRLEGEYILLYKPDDTYKSSKVSCMCTVHLKQEIKSKSPVSFMLGGGAFDTNYDQCNPTTGTYACTLVNDSKDIGDDMSVSMLMYPGYGSASSTVWYVLTITDKDKENYKVTFAKHDDTAKNKISTIHTIESISKKDLTWDSFISSNIIPSLSCGVSMKDTIIEPGTYVFTARGVTGGYKKWVSFWVEQLKNAPEFIATQVCVDWKYFTNEIDNRNTALKEFEEYVLEQYKSENINTMLVVDEDLLKANYDTDPKSISDDHLVVCKLRNSTESELLTCAVAARLSACGCETATAEPLDISILSDPDNITYYDTATIKKNSGRGVLCIHKIIGVPNPAIYHDITSYKSSDYSSGVDFVHTRGYAVRTIGKLIYDIGVMYNSRYVGKLRNNAIDLLKSDVYAICKKYVESNHIVSMNSQDIVINADPLSETASIILPIKIAPYVETVLLTISI